MTETMIKTTDAIAATMSKSTVITITETISEPCVRRSTLPYTAAEIFALFAEEQNAAFLDSSLENNLGQYSIIGLVPYHEVNVEKGRLSVNGQ